MNVNFPIETYEPLRGLVRFYPTNLTKVPLLRGRKLSRLASDDPRTIRDWDRCWVPNGFAAYINRRGVSGQLVVLDLDVKNGHNGYTKLVALGDQYDFTLPETAPIVRTPSGGFHMYFKVPKGIRIQSQVNLWDGIDVLTAGRSVMQAGSRTEHGSYKVIRGFDIGIPDLPRGLAALIRDEQRRTTAAKLVRIGPKVNLASLPRSGEAGLTQREWCRLLRNRYFANAWHKGKKLGDQSNSAYEYHLAKGALCQGLSEEQADHIIGAWRTHHNAWGSGGGRRRAAIRTTIVKAWREVSAWVAAWQERKRLDAEARAGKATRNQILAVIAQHGPQTPKSAAEHLGMRRERTKKALQRMAAAGELKKVTRGRYGTTSGTSSSTTEAQAAALPRIARKESPTTIAARALLGSNPLITAAELRAHLGITSKYAAVLIRRIGRRMAATLEQQVMADTLSSTLAQHANVNLPTSIRQCQHTEVNAPMALIGASTPEANNHPFCGDTHKCPREVFPFPIPFRPHSYNTPASTCQYQHAEGNTPMVSTGASMPVANDHPFCGDTHKCPLEVFPFLSAP